MDRKDERRSRFDRKKKYKKIKTASRFKAQKRKDNQHNQADINGYLFFEEEEK